MKECLSIPQRVLFCAMVISTCMTLRAQGNRVDHNIATSANGGWHLLYEMHADPENAHDVILCGARADPKDNALYGFVYSSLDGGKTWRQALEDKNSTFESEQSCAFGVHGVAYYVASASKMIDGDPHHDLGTTRIYVSHDAGKTWTLCLKTGWTDYSTAVVDSNPGPNQNRLYVFFNNLHTFYHSIGDQTAVAAERNSSNGTRVGMISFKEGDSAIAGPFSSEEMTKEGYQGSYPSPALVLSDGSILTFFSAKRRTAKHTREFMVESVRTTQDRTGLETPVKVVDSLDSPENDPTVPCGGYFLDSAGAYDARNNKLYFAYSDVRDKKCHLFLTTSADDGKSWSKSQQVWSPDGTDLSSYNRLSIAVNQDGTLGFLWQDESRSGCWRFSVSTDGGRSVSRTRDFGTCSAEEMKPSALTSAYLWTSVSQADPNNPESSAHINLRNTRNSVWRNQNAVIATADGKFHIVWSDAGNGSGELRTATVTVTPSNELIDKGTNGLADVTNKVAVLYGGDQYYDAKTKLITLDVVIKNDSDEPLAGPFKLAVPSLYKDYGFADIANSDNGVSDAGAVWDFSSAVSGGALAPGATTKPFALKFHYLADPDTQRASDDILGLSVRVYAAK